MNLFSRFSQTIKSLLPAGISPEDLSKVSSLNPERIDVENVRSVLGLSYGNALRILETAVRQGVFHKHIGVLRPDGSIGASADTERGLPTHISYWGQDDEGHPEEMRIPTTSLKKVVYYSL